ncbi:MAG: FecR family protein [Planctomycetota bacterium]
MTHSDEVRSMFAQYARNEISEERLRRLEAALREDDGLRAEFIEYMNVDAALGDLAALSQSEIDQLDSNAAETFEEPQLDLETQSAEDSAMLAERVSNKAIGSKPGYWKLIATLAVCLVVAITLAWQLGKETRPENQLAGENVEEAESPRKVDSLAFATVVQLADAHWEDDTSLAVGDRVAVGVLRLKAGIVHLQIDSGVGVTLDGPANFELMSSEVTRLHSGLLTATVPPGAEGFRVDTPSAQVVDLGTAFGIDQRSDGTSTVSVFDGEVEIVSVEESEKRLLAEGETVHVAADGSLRDMQFTPQPFGRLWPTASGIAESTGAFRFAPPWPRGLSQIQSDTEIFVLPEGYARELSVPCPIDITESELNNSRIPAERRVRSYLLQFNPVDPTGEEAASKKLGSRMRRIEGSITFDHPVAGMIVNSETLKITDEVFALRRGPIRPFARGLELSQPRTADVISLSEDRHTVNLKLSVFNQFSDHVRVIVDASFNNLED